MTTTLVLTRGDVGRVLGIGDCIDVVERAFRLHAEGATIPAGVLGVHVEAGGFHVKTAGLLEDRPIFAAKVNANFPGNPARFGLPTIQGVVTLFDAERGEPLALIDSAAITSLRTAAATAVAAKYLARTDATVATICGCGEQGRSQLRALAARQSHVIVTCTPARRWLLGRGDVSAGAFVAAVGADYPEKQEIEPALMGESRVVVDVLEQCERMGDLHHAIVAGVMTRDDVAADLADVVSGGKPGRQREDDIVIFDSTGTALQDVAAAGLLYERALAAGIGVPVNFSAR